ncbi:hypothetical protein Tco_0620709 [Tanacetum coccineum]
MKRLKQMRLDGELAFKLQAEEAKVKADYQLAQRLQAQEQEELTDEEKAREIIAIDAIPLAVKPPRLLTRRIIKEAKQGSTRPEEGYERVLWGDLKKNIKFRGGLLGLKDFLMNLQSLTVWQDASIKVSDASIKVSMSGED